MRKISLFLLFAFVLASLYVISCKKETYETKFKPMPGVVFTNGDTITVNLDKGENPTVPTEIISAVGLKYIKIGQVVNDTITVLDSIALKGVAEYKLTIKPAWRKGMQAIWVETYDTRDIGYTKMLITNVFLSAAPKVTFMATSLDVNLNKLPLPTITGTIESALGLVSVKYFLQKGSTEEVFGTEVSFAVSDSVKSYPFEQTPTYDKTVTGFKVVATDRKSQISESTLPITISPVSITFDSVSLSVNNRMDEQKAITAKVSSDANILSIKVIRLDSVKSSKTVKETEIAEIIPSALEYQVNITDFKYTTTVCGCKLVATDANGATNSKSITILPTNEDPLLSVYKNKLIYTQSQRTIHPFSFATVDGTLYELNNTDTLEIDGKRNSAKIDFLVYCGTSGDAGFNIWAPGGDEPESGLTPCSSIVSPAAGAVLWKNVYKAPSGCTAGDCCSDNVWPIRNKTLFNYDATKNMTRDEFLNSTMTEVDAIAAGTVYNTGYIKGKNLGVNNLPKVVGFMTANGKKGLLLLDSYINLTNTKDNQITISVKVAK